jgi:hypothetical protein
VRTGNQKNIILKKVREPEEDRECPKEERGEES